MEYQEIIKNISRSFSTSWSDTMEPDEFLKVLSTYINFLINIDFEIFQNNYSFILDGFV